MDAHNKHVKEAVDSNSDDPIKVGLGKSGIAGTETEKEDGKEEEKKEEDKSENGDKKDEPMEVSLQFCYLFTISAKYLNNTFILTGNIFPNRFIHAIKC